MILKTVCFVQFVIMVGSALFFFLVVATSQVFADDPVPLGWPQQYSVKGVIQLPYAKIEEPFQAWVDLKNGKSRIDYYDGTDKTFQMGPKGTTKFLHLMTARVCIAIKQNMKKMSERRGIYRKTLSNLRILFFNIF